MSVDLVARVIAHFPSAFGVTRAQVEAFQALIAPRGTITGNAYDDLVIVCWAYSSSCSAHGQVDWLPFDRLPDWQNSVLANLYSEV